MAQDATRRLLKVFGMGVTDCEEALERLEAAVAGGAGRAAVGPAAEAYGQAARTLAERWLEVGRLLREYQDRAQRGFEATLRGE